MKHTTLSKVRKTKIGTLKRKADKLMSLFIRKVGHCERCGKAENLQCAHVITRSNLHLRYDTQNLMALCAGCHLWWHKEPLEAIQWFYSAWPERVKYLTKEKYVIGKPDYEAIIEHLENFV